MDIAKARCADCGHPPTITQLSCLKCGMRFEGEFDASPLAWLSPEDQVFVTAFVRHHGSIKKMEQLFEISYPTVKNRLNAVIARIDRSFEAPSSNSRILEQLANGELSVDDAIERME